MLVNEMPKRSALRPSEQRRFSLFQSCTGEMRTTKSCRFVRLQLAFVNLPLGILYQENFLHQSLDTIRSKHQIETISNVEALP